MAITTCTVSGTIKDPSNTVISGTVVKASITTPFLHGDGTYIADYELSTEVDANGAWSLTLIETTSISKKITIEIVYPTGNGTRSRTYSITVPATASANFHSLISENE
jgi:hypothetical protein